MTVRRKSGSVFALGLRLTRLGPTGAPLVGPKNAFLTDNLVRIEYSLEMREGEEKERLNGAGRACLYYSAPPTVKQLKVDGLELCYPDPELTEFIGGGEVLVDEDDDTVGYAAPEVGSAITPNGISIEAWSSAILDDGVDGAFPYIWWTFPRTFLVPDGSSEIGVDPLAAAYAGTGMQNPNWGNGPFNDWDYESGRVYQWARSATMPDLTVNGYATVPANTP